MSLEQVYSSRSEMVSGPVGPLRAKQLVPIAVLVAACALAFGLTVVRLHSLNDLDAVPRSLVAGGAYDPGGLPFSPSDGEWLLGCAAIVLTPLVAGAGALFTGIDLAESLRSGRAPRALAPGAAVLVLCAATLTGYASYGSLIAWWMD